MVWFKVDDGLPFNPKVLQAGNAAMGLWVRAGAWSMQQLTDGRVPDTILQSLGTRNQAEALARAGLWDRADNAWQFRGWNDEGRQKTKATVEEERAAAAERQRKSREARGMSHRDSRVSHGDSHADVTGGVTPTQTRPDQTRPTTSNEVVGSAPSPTSKSTRRKPEQPLPDGWGPANSAYEYCELHNLDIRHEESQFRNHVAANDRRQRDWDAAFRTWLGNAKKYQPAHTQPRQTAAQKNMPTVDYFRRLEEEAQRMKEIEG